MIARKHSVRTWIVGVLCGATAILTIAFWYCAGPVIPQALLRRVVPGTPKEEIVRLLGQPSAVDNRQWIYDRWANPGWVEISFGEDGRVQSVNDESPFLPNHGTHSH
jgi:hypothetical protein